MDRKDKIMLQIEAINAVRNELRAAEDIIETNEIVVRLVCLNATLVDDVQALMEELKSA